MFQNYRYVNSTALNFVAYAPSTQTLRVVFNSGSVYDYSGVPATEYVALSLAQSVGTYFSRHIRDNRSYTCTRLTSAASATFLMSLNQELRAQTLLRS